AHVEPVVEQARAPGGAVGQGDVDRRAAEIGARRAQDVCLEAALILVQVVDRVVVEPPAVCVDRVADGRRVRRQQQAPEVQQVGIEIEQAADGCPVVQVRLGAYRPPVETARSQRGRGQPQARPYQEPPTLDPLKVAAVSGACQEPHDRVAHAAAAGMGSLLGLRGQQANVAAARYSTWLAKPKGMPYADFYAALESVPDSLWRRQMVLGP